jgi:hypothetical protein
MGTARTLATLVTGIPALVSTVFKLPSTPTAASAGKGGSAAASAFGTQISAEITHPLPLPVEVTNFPGQPATPYASSVSQPTAPAATTGLGASSQSQFGVVEIQHPLPLPVEVVNPVEIGHPLPLDVVVTNFPNVPSTPTASSISAQTPYGSSTARTLTAEAAEAPEAAGGAEAAAGGLGAIAGPIGIAVAAVLVAGTEIKALGEQAWATGMRFAAIANPATTQLYERSIMDAQAVIGQRFVPVVELATTVMRDVGWFLVEVLPSVDEVRTALSELRPDIDQIRVEFHNAAPMIKEFVFTGLHLFVGTVGMATTALKYFVQAVNAYLGIKFNLAAPASAVGASAGNVTIGSAEDMARQIFQASVEQGRVAGPAETTATNTTRIANVLEKIGFDIGDGKNELRNKLAVLAHLPGLAGSIFNALKAGLGDGGAF